MTLASGSRLGPYEILAPLGAGGMGEVFRARDTKLNREVALKILPQSVAQDAERLARFEREAQLLAALNHPHIAAIYGVEDSTTTKALVLELVEGETLGERLGRGPLPVEETVEIARQIAEALEVAHERGIVHRDLKPQNIKLTGDGAVKVLDFGLAKALDPGAASQAPAQSPTLMNSPTLTAAGTQMGVILGTAAYMAPEQAKGKAVDRRADIWAFGVVLWECLTGKPLFAADTVAETIGYVMTREPDAALLPRSTPAALRELIVRCLARDPRRRLQAIGEARVTLEDLAARRDTAAAPSAAATGARLLAAAPWAIAAAALLLAAGLGLARRGAIPSSPLAPRRTEIVGLSAVASSNIAISPDGREIVAYDMTPSRPVLLRRALDSFDIRAIPGSESGFNPFFSPDGKALGFFANQKLCLLGAADASRRCLADAHGFASGSWGADGTIVYANLPKSDDPRAGLWRIAARGGEPARVTAIDRTAGERQHIYPQILPDGRNVLFSIVGERQNSIAVVPLDGGAPRRLIPDALRARYVHSGHLVYWDFTSGRVNAIPFDLRRLALAGAAVELDFVAAATGDQVPAFDVSDNGTLVYSISGQLDDDFTVERIDRSGRMTPMLSEHGSWAQPRLSPDGRVLLLRRAAQPDCSLWLFDLVRHSLQRLSIEGDTHNPLWLPDGERFLVSLQTPGRTNRQVHEQSLDNAAAPAIFAATDFAANGESVSADGRYLALTLDGRRERNDILVFDRQTGRTTPLLTSDYDEDHPAISPDGRFLAYAANDSGRSEVYVRPFQGPGGKYPISTNGGTGPQWSRDGRELFYAEGTKMMRVAVTTTPRFEAGEPTMLFETPDIVWERPRNYDVLADGSGFIVVRRGAATPLGRSLRVVFDWSSELARLAPASAPP